MTLPQIVSAVTGGICCVGSLYVFVRQRTRRFKALVWLALGAAMVYAAYRPQIIELLGPDTTELRLRLVVVLLSFIVITVTLEAIRIARMQERYALLWLLTGVILFTGALSYPLADFVSRLTGMSYGATVMVILFVFIMSMLFHVSVTLSRTQRMLARIVQELALVEERLRHLEHARHPVAKSEGRDSSN